MSAAVFFIIQTLFELYILCFLLRLVLQITRADFHNPLSQFIVRVTSPVVAPLRRVVPSVRGLGASLGGETDDDPRAVRGIGGGADDGEPPEERSEEEGHGEAGAGDGGEGQDTLPVGME